MATEPAPTSPRVDLGALRRRAVQHELLELLVLRQRAVLSGVAGTVALGVLLTLVAPGIVPSTALVGVLVGLLALAVGFAAAVVVHRQDPVLRAPGQARWDGSSVMAWVPSFADEHGVAPALDVIKARLRSTGRQRLLLIDGGADARAAGIAIGDAAAGVGIRTLLVDLTDTRPQPGMAAVGDGSVRLADAVEIAEGRRLARIGAGSRIEDSVSATVATLERPNRDLELAVVVAPDDAASRLALLRTVDRAVLVVAAGTRQRAAVRDRLQQFDAGVAAELLLVGGHLTDAAVAKPAEPPVHEPGDAPAEAPREAVPGEAATDGAEPVGPPPGPPPQVAVLGDRGDDVAPPPSPPPSLAPPGGAPADAGTPTLPPPGADTRARPVDGADADPSTAPTDREPHADGPSLLGGADVGRSHGVPPVGPGSGPVLAATQLLTPVRHDDVAVVDVTPTALDDAVEAELAPDAEDGDRAEQPITTVDEPWRLRSFHPDDEGAPEDGTARAEAIPDDAPTDDLASWAWLGETEPEPVGPLDAGVLADGHVEPEDDDRMKGNGTGSPGGAPDLAESRDLAGPGDLVTTATLEFLATGDRDAER